MDGATLSIRRIDWAGPVAVVLSCQASEKETVYQRLLAAGGVRVSGDAGGAVDALRIEAGFPEYGRDVTDANLPQEVARDRLAMSFHKGCYLGQETVARIDALGHVNRYLVGVRFDGGGIPPVGTPLSAEGKTLGNVTSATFSPRLGVPLALAYVRRGHHGPGTRLDSPLGTAEVVALPLPGTGAASGL
jgi:hypothetical protein